jgi:nitrile hydratase
MGGRTEFFGPVMPESGEPVFHDRWEGRVFGLSFQLILLLGRSTDRLRFAMEKLPPETYLSAYYQRWLAGFESLLVEGRFLAPGELDARMTGRRVPAGRRRVSAPRRNATVRMVRSGLRPTLPRRVAGDLLPRLLGTARPVLRRPRFGVGDGVRVIATRPAPYTRLPGYVTGRPGVIVARLGATLFPDAHTVGRHAWPQHLYTVAFQGVDLWGAAAEPRTEVRVDLYESYLETSRLEAP